MYMNTKKMLLAMMMIFGLVACSSSDDNGPLDDDDLTGTYTACEPPANALDPSSRYELSFSDNRFTLTTTSFSEAGCTGTNLGTQTEQGTFSTSGNNIDYAYDTGVTIYDIYQVNGLNLRVGDRSGANNGSTPELRPTAYEDSFEFSKN
jgi:hypothetical protein